MSATKAVQCLVGVWLLWGVDARAQTGAVKGRVVGEQGEPIEKVEVLIEYLGGVTRKLTTVTTAKGDFIQIGLQTGMFKLTFRKEGYEPVSQDYRVRLGEPLEIGKVVLRKIPEGGMAKAEAAKLSSELKQAFDAGVEASREGNHQGAIDAFKKVLELEPDSPEAAFNLGVIYEKSGNVEQAISYFQKATELRSDYYEAYVELGNLYNARRGWPEAMKALAKAIEIRPSEPAPLFNYGAIAMNTGDIPAAEQAFAKLVAIDPNHAAAHYQLGMAYVNQMKNAEAIVHLEKYLALDPEGTNAATAKGILDYLKKN